jgi:hypothetical protein
VIFPFFFIVGHIEFNSLFILPFSTWYSTKLSTQGEDSNCRSSILQNLHGGLDALSPSPSPSSSSARISVLVSHGHPLRMWYTMVRVLSGMNVI